MKQLIDFIPLVIFFVFYKLYDIFVGVGALMIASTLALALTFYLYRKIEKVALFTYAMVMIFGALTLFFHNDEFIKWKVTIIYSLFALVLLVSQYLMKKNLIQAMLGKEMKLPDTVWSKVNLAWAIFFLICGLANIYISYQLSQEAWVNYKTLGLPGLTLLFTFASIAYMYQYLPKESDKTSAEPALDSESAESLEHKK